jgi:hypothetical protein
MSPISASLLFALIASSIDARDCFSCVTTGSRLGLCARHQCFRELLLRIGQIEKGAGELQESIRVVPEVSRAESAQPTLALRQERSYGEAEYRDTREHFGSELHFFRYNLLEPDDDPRS